MTIVGAIKTLTITEAIEYLKEKGHNISKQHLSLLCRQGKIKAIAKEKIVKASAWEIPEEELIDFKPIRRMKC